MADDQQVEELTPLDAVRQATEDKRTAAEADLRWRAAIRAAIAAGVPVREIAEAAHLSRDRVYQIRDDRR